jgi:galactokinase
VEAAGTLLLANLMNESHKSTSQLYDCSCEELDRLCSIMRNSAGCWALGTGAGWEGVRWARTTESATQVLERIKSRYYVATRGIEQMAVELDSYCFAFEPAAGAVIKVCSSLEFIGVTMAVALAGRRMCEITSYL